MSSSPDFKQEFIDLLALRRFDQMVPNDLNWYQLDELKYALRRAMTKLEQEEDGEI